MIPDGGDRSDQTGPASVAALIGALVLVAVGGFISAGTIVSLFERGSVDPGTAGIYILLGLGLIAIALVVIRRSR